MTLTDRSMEWLDQNRHRSYPMQRDSWRAKASPESGLDCVLLDALVFDPDSDPGGASGLWLESVNVESARTTVFLRYRGADFSMELTGGGISGLDSFESVSGTSSVPGVSMSLVFSSHAYIKSVLGVGTWTLGCPALRSRTVCLTDGRGVDGVSVKGSSGVEGHGDEALANGEVVLEDGYRTSPVVRGDKVMVRVGTRYGLDPCEYDFGDAGARDCRRPLFYFCGQNAVNSGNVVLMGGKGVVVSQGREYTVHDPYSKCYGMSIPCVEIAAGPELLDIYSPDTGA